MAHNAFWNVVDIVVANLGILVVNVVMARKIGPVRLGYFNLIYLTTNMVGLLGSLGLPGACSKYIAEFLGAGRKDYARALFFFSLRAQALLALLMTAVGLALFAAFGDPQYRVPSILLIVSIFPQMLILSPSQANVGAESFHLNVRAGIIAAAVNVAGVALSLALHWDLIGIAATVVAYRAVELILKMRATLPWVCDAAPARLPEDIRRKVISFALFSVVLLLLNVVVWDRSDVILLKWLQTDIRQIAFFSLAFGLADRLLKLPQALSGAMGASQMVEYGRDRERMLQLTSMALTYTALGALPLLIGAACVASPLLRLAYGPQYLPAIAVFVVVALFAFPKCVLQPAQTLLYSTSDFRFLIAAVALSGVLNIVLDVALIPKHGAFGAAIGNGVAQTVAASALWFRAIAHHGVRLQLRLLRRLSFVTVFMALFALLGVRLPLSMPLRLACGVLFGAVAFAIALRIWSVFGPQDRARFSRLQSQLPRFLQPLPQPLIDFVAPQEGL